MQLEYEKEVYNLYLDYMGIEDNDVSYKMFIWDVLYDELQKFDNINKLNITEWELNNVTYYGLKDKTSTYCYYLYTVKDTKIEIDVFFNRWLTKLKEFILNIEELDLTKCKEGDKLLTKDGQIAMFRQVDDKTSTNYVIDLDYTDCVGANCTKDGFYYDDKRENDRNIIKILN